jgi:hypothetical protein
MTVRSALTKYDERFRITDNDSGTKYALLAKTKTYPPKDILSFIIGKPKTSFYGGKLTNHIFEDLKFKIVDISKQRVIKSPLKRRELRRPIPKIEELTKRLFTQRWVLLDPGIADLEDAGYPGVYALAYSTENLSHNRVRPRDVFYVGMSHAGVIKRLKQFIGGLKHGGYHSGAKRFYENYAHDVPYSKLKNRKKFFVASISVPCIAAKLQRSPTDLRKMGIVAAFELYVLAHVKELTGAEPELNKK